MNPKPPRIGMPAISVMAHKELSKRPGYNNPKVSIIKPINEESYNATIQELSQRRIEITPKLKELKQILDIANAAYFAAYDSWRELAVEYEKLDRKEKTLIHEQTVALKANKPKETKSKSTEEDATKFALKVLANLSPEKRAEILALIQKQIS